MPLESVSARLIFADTAAESKKFGQKNSDRKRRDKRARVQGDKEKGRQGIVLSLSPCPLVPLSPLTLFPYSGD
jgi:hypothetical protein